jgi:hypothetical protein
MVEVFKTNVDCMQRATEIVGCIHRMFTKCEASFDLDDCDRILRIKAAGAVDNVQVINLLAERGFSAEVLPD